MTEVAKHAPAHALALVSVGNRLRGDDGIAEVLVSRLPAELTQGFCLLSAGGDTSQIPEFVRAHEAAIVVDAVPFVDGTEAVCCELNFQAPAPVEIRSSHGLSWWDELRLARIGNEVNRAPTRIWFFGVPVISSNAATFSDELQARLGSLVMQLELFVRSCWEF